MEAHQKGMNIYVGDNMETVIPPDLPDEARLLVMVVHDESCFQSNDAGTTGWFDQDCRQIRPKGTGKSLMVSAFLCECHGLLRLSDELCLQFPDAPVDSTEIIRPGCNGDGYWTNEDLVKQTKLKALPIFKILHPHSDALFMFDNSANHHVFAPDALVASRLNLKDGGANLKIIMRDGWFTNEDGDRISHSFISTSGVQKGLRTILTERNLWKDGMKRADACDLLKARPYFIRNG